MEQPLLEEGRLVAAAWALPKRPLPEALWAAVREEVPSEEVVGTLMNSNWVNERVIFSDKGESGHVSKFQFDALK